MKKFLFLAASAALVLASCAKNEIVVNPAQQESIGFGSYVGQSPLTKADIDNATTLQGRQEGFGVFAYYGTYDESTTANLMSNTQITYQSTVWDYATASETKYWSTTDDDVYSFFAYAPYMANTAMTTGKVVMPTYSELDEDFLVAVAQVDQKRSTYKTDGKVPFVFRHAKAKLAVKATDASTEESHTLTVNKITIGNIYKGGSVAMKLEKAADKVVWSDLTDNTRSIEYTLSNNSSTTHHLIVPYNYTNLPVTVDYTLTQGSVVYNNQVAKGTLAMNLSGSTSYILNVNVKLDEITFSVTEVNKWDDATGSVINGNATAE